MKISAWKSLMPYFNPKSEINLLIKSKGKLPLRVVKHPTEFIFESLLEYEKSKISSILKIKWLSSILTPLLLLKFIFHNKRIMDEAIFKVSLNLYDDAILSVYVQARALFYGKMFSLIIIGITLWMFIKLQNF